MLKSLARALRTWTPGGIANVPSSPEQALGEIVSLWPRIVGDDVARHAAPLERNGDALLVLVSSSSWSNQLSLLSGHITRALGEAGISGIERLRFRIRRSGRISPAHAGRSNGKPSIVGPARTSEPSTTLEEAFSRLRDRVVREREAKHAHGWNQCPRCGAMLPEGHRCAPCATAEISERSARVQRLMFDVPWLGFNGTAQIVEGLTRDEYEATREILLARWWETLQRVRKTGRLSTDGYERQVASSYLLLKTGWEPDRITPTIARNELTDEIYELIYAKYHQENTK